MVQKEHIYIVDIEANFQTYNRAYKIKQEKGYIIELFCTRISGDKSIKGEQRALKIFETNAYNAIGLLFLGSRTYYK